MGFFSPVWGWLRALDLDGDADMGSGEEWRPGLGSEFWLSSSKTNLLIVMRLFLGCSSEPPSPSVRAEFSFSSFLGLLFLWVGDDGDGRLGSTRSFWSSFAKAASESCAVDRALKAAFRVLIPMVVGGSRGCLQRKHIGESVSPVWKHIQVSRTFAKYKASEDSSRLSIKIKQKRVGWACFL